MKTGDMMKFDLHVYVSIWVNFLPAARNRITRIFKKHLGSETMNIFIGSIGYIYIYWVWPPPRIPVTTRIITCLVGDPNLNLHFPLLLGGGHIQDIYPP